MAYAMELGFMGPTKVTTMSETVVSEGGP